MAVERLAKEVHDACLERDYEQALEKTLALIVEARLTHSSIKHVQEKENSYESRTAQKDQDR